MFHKTDLMNLNVWFIEITEVHCLVVFWIIMPLLYKYSIYSLMIRKTNLFICCILSSEIHYNWINVSYLTISQNRLDNDCIFYLYQTLPTAPDELHNIMISGVLKERMHWKKFSNNQSATALHLTFLFLEQTCIHQYD